MINPSAGPAQPSPSQAEDEAPAPLCSPGRGLTCFACCPPIRPAGHDHLDHRSSWRRLLCDNRADFLAGRLPTREIIGFFCPGLGFLDSAGRSAGCLYHPARNQGRDLRAPTGYQPKCARESCPEFRAFARLEPAAREALLDLCQGLDAFAFSSRRANPVMRLLAFGPEVAATFVSLGLAGREALAGLGWLCDAPPAWGWLIGRLADQRGAEVLMRPDLAATVAGVVESLARELGPAPPLAGGRGEAESGDEWEARFWLTLGLARTDGVRLGNGRALLGKLLSRAGDSPFPGGPGRAIMGM